MSATPSAVRSKLPRQPARFGVAKTFVSGPVSTAVPACEPAEVDCSEQTAPVRAVLEAKPSTCRFVLGEGREDFAFCGQRSTVAAAGALSWCQEHANLVYVPSARAAGESGQPAHMLARPHAVKFNRPGESGR